MARLPLLKTITAFTVAHSITLAIATLGYANAPMVPLNAAIALSILFLGPEIVRSWRGETSFSILHPWVVAFAFGLLHGFGFASALTSAGLPHSELPLALLSFNVGVETGQMAFVLLIWLLEQSFRVLEVRWPSYVKALPGYTVGSLGAYWTVQRRRTSLGCAMKTIRRHVAAEWVPVFLTIIILCAQAAHAHVQKGEAAGFLSGFRHRLSGLDHVLAMTAVGLWGAQLGAPAIWVLPVAFPMVMAICGMLGLRSTPANDNLVAVELAIKKPAAEQPASCGLVVVLSGGRRIEVQRDFDVHTFERLVSVMERV
jgi:hydrogenase/urease accessory protein HupE